MYVSICVCIILNYMYMKGFNVLFHYFFILDDADAGEIKKSHKSMRRRQHEAAKNQKQEDLSKHHWQKHRHSVSSHSSGEEVLLLWCIITVCHYVDNPMELMFKLYTFHRVRGQWWPDLPLRQKCCLVHKLRPHPLRWMRTQRVKERPRQETPVMPCQVHRNHPCIVFKPLHCFFHTFLSFSSSRCLLRGFQHLQFLGRESGWWPIPGGPQLQHGLPATPQHTPSQPDSTTTQSVGLSPWLAAKTAW